MTDVAIQVSKDGISYAVMSDPLDLDADVEIKAAFRRWPTWDFGHTPLPRHLYERYLAFDLVLRILRAGDATGAIWAVEVGVDERLVGAVEIALGEADVGVALQEPHVDGAAGLMKDWIREIGEATPLPLGM